MRQKQEIQGEIDRLEELFEKDLESLHSRRITVWKARRNALKWVLEQHNYG